MDLYNFVFEGVHIPLQHYQYYQVEETTVQFLVKRRGNGDKCFSKYVPVVKGLNGSINFNM